DVSSSHLARSPPYLPSFPTRRSSDLEAFVRTEAGSDNPLVPRRFEVGFGTERAAPELQRGLDLGGATLSGKIDRIDVDPFSARRSEEHTSELQSLTNLVCRLLLEKNT